MVSKLTWVLVALLVALVARLAGATCTVIQPNCTHYFPDGITCGAGKPCGTGGGGGITSLAQGTGLSFSVNPIVATGTINLAVPVALANGGTGADLSATGAAHRVLQQSALGAAVTVGQLAFTDIGGTLGIGAGGTGQTTQQAAFDALSPLSATGDLVLFSGGHNIALTTNATATRKFLRAVSSGAPAWDTLVAGDIPDVSATYVPVTRTISTTAPLGGGGALSGNLTLTLATPLVIGFGGTGQTTATAAFDALAPTTTRGDIIVRGAASNGRLGLGTTGQYPKSNGTDLINSTLAASGVGSCTNQFVRAANADATPTCASVAATDFASSTDPFGGVYTKLAGRSGSGNDTLLSTTQTGKLWGSHVTANGLTLLPNDVDATGDISLDGESILRPSWPDPAGTTSYLQRFTRTQTVTGASSVSYAYDVSPTLTFNGSGSAQFAALHQGGTLTAVAPNPTNLQFQAAVRADYATQTSTANVGPWLPDTILELWTATTDTVTATSPVQYIALGHSWAPTIRAINGGKYYMGNATCSLDPTSGMGVVYGGGTVSSAGAGGDICVPRRSLVWDVGTTVSTSGGSTATLYKDSTVYSKDRTKATNTNALSVIDSDLTAGSGKYDLHLVGGAQNVIAGNVRIGSTADPSNALDVTGAETVSTSLTTPLVIGGTATNATLALQASSSATPTIASTIVLGPQTRTIPNGAIFTDTDVFEDAATLTFAGANSIYTFVDIGATALAGGAANWTAAANISTTLGGGIILLFNPKIQNTAGSAQTLGTWQLLQANPQIDCNGNGGATACSTGNVLAVKQTPNLTSTSSGVLTVAAGYGLLDNTTIGTGTIVTELTTVKVAPTNSGTVTTRYGLDFAAAGGGANPTQIALNVADLASTGTITEASVIHSALAFSSGKKWLVAATGAADSSIAGNVILGPTTLTVPSAQLHLAQQTLGNEVFRAESVATNDDPNYRIFQNRATAAASTATAINKDLTAAVPSAMCPASDTCLIETRTVCHCTGGSSCTTNQGGGATSQTVVKNNGGTLTAVNAVTAVMSQVDASLTSIVTTVSSPNIVVTVTVPANFSHTCHVTYMVQNVGT